MTYAFLGRKLALLLRGILPGLAAVWFLTLSAAETPARDAFAADVSSSEAVSREEAPPLVWFIHGMILVRDDFDEELTVLRKIFPNADAVTMKRWKAPKGPARTPEEHWEKSLIEAERFAKTLEQQILDLPPADRDRLVLVGHSLGGRIAVRALASVFRQEKLQIRQLILAGAAIDSNDPDVPLAVQASRLMAYSLINESDVMLTAYKIAENQSALGAGGLFTLEPDRFYEIALNGTVDHYGYEYFERLLACIRTDDFRNSSIIVPQDASQLNLTTMGGETFWRNLNVFMGWKLQRHSITGHCRLLNEENVRVASGRLPILRQSFARVRQQLEQRAEFRIPSDDVTFPTLRPVLQFDALGSDGWWRTLEQFRGWTLQQNRSTFHFRILDPQHRRRACGTGKEIRLAFQKLQAELTARDEP